MQKAKHYFKWQTNKYRLEMSTGYRIALPFRGPCRGWGWGGYTISIFWMVKDFYFNFGYPDLSLTTQTRFSNLTILNTTKREQTLSCSCCNEFVVINDNRKGNFGAFRESNLKMPGWHSTFACVGFSFKVYSFQFCSNEGGPGCNLLL